MPWLFLSDILPPFAWFRICSLQRYCRHMEDIVQTPSCVYIQRQVMAPITCRTTKNVRINWYFLWCKCSKYIFILCLFSNKLVAQPRASVDQHRSVPHGVVDFRQVYTKLACHLFDAEPPHAAMLVVVLYLCAFDQTFSTKLVNVNVNVNNVCLEGLCFSTLSVLNRIYETGNIRVVYGNMV